MMLDVRRLRLLYELSARGTLAEVASAMHQSPSSVSQQLAQLEKEAGVQLLRKVGRGVRLTAAADQLVVHAASILDQLERATAELSATEYLSEHHALTGTVRIAAFQSAALAFMPEALSQLAQKHPQLRVTMTQREPEEALRETWLREFDLVIAEQYPGHAAPWFNELDRVDLTTDTLRLAVPASSWDSIKSIEQSSPMPWVMEPAPAASRHWAEQRCRAAGFEPDVRFETADLQAHLALVASGNAVAILPGLMTSTPGENTSRTVRLLDLPHKPHRSLFTATRRSMSAWPALRACRDVLASTVELTTRPHR